MRRKHGQTWRSLDALAVALEADEAREPYPRLAQLMQTLTYGPIVSRTGPPQRSERQLVAA
jgi:hypothetical protein